MTVHHLTLILNLLGLKKEVGVGQGIDARMITGVVGGGTDFSRWDMEV